MLILEFGGKWFTDNTLCSYLSFASIIILHLKWSRDRKIPGFISRPNLLFISRAVSNLYGTEIEIWAGFGPFANTEKKIWSIMNNFWGRFIHAFMVNFFSSKYCSSKKLHKKTKMSNPLIRPTKTTCRGCFGSQTSKYIVSDSRESRDLG